MQSGSQLNLTFGEQYQYYHSRFIARPDEFALHHIQLGLGNVIEMDGATTTSVETTMAPQSSTTLRRTADNTVDAQPAPKQVPALNPGHQKLSGKYRHVAAVHSATRPSTLSHDSTAAPSFLGFRNLMVIVLGTRYLPPARLVSLLIHASGRKPPLDD